MTTSAVRRCAESAKIQSLLLRTAASRLTAPAQRTVFTSTNRTIHLNVHRIKSPSKTFLWARYGRSVLSRNFRPSRFNSSKTTRNHNPNPTPYLGSPAPAPSLSQRLRKLSREYGWSALGVYLALTALDFPFCFLAVRMAGPDRIGHYEHAVIDAFWKVVQVPFPNFGKQKEAQETSNPSEDIAQATAREGHLGWSDEVDAADAKNRGAEASIWTQLALAYAIHKAFIFVRVPLTAALTPRVVKTLRGWGWDIGKRKPKSK